MKDIITDLSMTETKSQAIEKWREYVAAEKMYRKPEYTDMKKVYNQLKQGRKVIDIFKVIQRGGIRDNYHPALAIAQITKKIVYCAVFETGTVNYVNREAYWTGRTASPTACDVHLMACLPTFDVDLLQKNNILKQYESTIHLKAPVPPVPPKIMPKVVTEDYYILWEVDEWKNAPPTDPWLLRRITKTLFVVLAGWDLTELEKSVMHGRMI